MLKIDIDEIGQRSRLDLQKILYAMPRPFSARISSSGNGLHISVPALPVWCWLRDAYDDPMRIELDRAREQCGLPVGNLLWDMKNGRQAHHWHTIKTERDIEDFIDAHKPMNILCHTAYTYMSQMGQVAKHDRCKHHHEKTTSGGIHRSTSPRNRRFGNWRHCHADFEQPGEPGICEMEDLT